MANRTIEAVLKLTSKLGSMRAFGELDKRMERVERKAKAYNRAQGRVTRGAHAMGAALMRYAAPAAVGYGLTRAVTDFADVERTLNRIAINADKGKDAVSSMLRTVNDVSHKYAMSQQQVTTGLETLVAAGMDLKDALAFLPSVMATAQASGAATEDLANSAKAVSQSFGITAEKMQGAFDILDKGGKQGQFELKDMARYLPDLAAMFATLGYKGSDGLRKLTALMQTVRLKTGSSESAARDLLNVFQKIYSKRTATNFKKFGVDLNDYLKKAKANGDDVLDAFIKITREVTKGDPSKLAKLFTDQQMYLGMNALLQSPDALKRFNAELKNTDGMVMKDLGQVLSDNKAKIDRMASAWEKFKLSVGAGLSSIGVTDALNSLASDADKMSAADEALKKRGYSFWQRQFHNASGGEGNRLARAGGWRDPNRGEAPASAPDFYKQGAKYMRWPHTPTPRQRSTMTPAGQRSFAHGGPRSSNPYLPKQPDASQGSGFSWGRFLFGRGADGTSVVDAARQDSGASSIKSAGEDAGKQISAGGKDAAKSLHDAAAAVNAAANNLRRASSGAGARDVSGTGDL